MRKRDIYSISFFNLLLYYYDDTFILLLKYYPILSPSKHLYVHFPTFLLSYFLSVLFCSFEKSSYICRQKIIVVMPKIFEYFGFIFYFYSNEHEPIHVHVIHGGKESIFDIIMMNGALAAISVREKKGAEPLTEKDKRTAEDFIRKYHKNIIEKWVKFFVLKQSVRSTSIKKKL